MGRGFSYVVGFDDAPFDREHRGDVALVGAVFNGARLEGVLRGRVRRDGANATRELIRLICESRFRSSLQAVLLQGVTLAGFNVVDVEALSERTGLPVVAVCRKKPDLGRVRRALLTRVPGGRRKWRLIEKLRPAEALDRVFVQRAGVSAPQAAALVRRFAINSDLPEPLRTAHLIAGALAASGESRHRA
jgi:endonuclease V-like protein UPF0215 family